MFDHIGLRVKDIAKAKKLYAAILAPLGHVAGPAGEGYAGFGPKDKPKLWLHADPKGGGAHVCFRAETRKAVDEFHAAGLKAGATDNGAPGLRPDYSPDYYGAFLLDGEGNNVEAVCFR
jgi:catechol 2,3-dioxygenase-like lactoylglutathione lyase family enzyme